MNFIRPFLCFLVIAAPAAAAVKEDIDPAKLNDKITVVVGKNVTVQFQQQGDAISEPKAVEKAEDNAPCATFSSKVNPTVVSGKDMKIVMLMTRHSFSKTLAFRALVRLQGRKDYKETSIIPVGKGLVGMESWMDPVEEIVLFDFKLSDKKP